MIKKIPIISNADLSPILNGVQKRGLQARAINALHCICVSGYYYDYDYYDYDYDY